MTTGNGEMMTARRLATQLAGIMVERLDDAMKDVPERDGPDEIKATALLVGVKWLVDRKPELVEYVTGAAHGLSMAISAGKGERPMSVETALWEAYRAALAAYVTDKSPACAAARLAAYTSWIRVYAPGDAEALVAEERARLEAACAA